MPAVSALSSRRGKPAINLRVRRGANGIGIKSRVVALNLAAPSGAEAAN